VFSNPANGTWSYLYDGASRLVQASGPNASGASTIYDYAYDGGGNRVLAKETTGTVVKSLTTAYDAAGLPTSATDAATGETVTYAHDSIGNLTGIDSSIAANDWTFAYDAYSRTTCAVQGSSCASGSNRVLFSLDALDRATTRVKGSSTTSLTYRGIGESLAKTVNGAATTTYVPSGSGAPLAEKTGSVASFYLADPRGDVVGLASTAAANQGTISFDPWGNKLATTGQTSFLGYQGDMTDPDTKQVDMGTRWYAAGLGRFTSRDELFGSLSSPATLNQHVYAGMNPITMWDPTGMGQCTMAGECVTTTPSGGSQAVGGNPGAANHPMHASSSQVHSGGSVDAGRAVDVTPRPPRPDPMVRDADFVAPRPEMDAVKDMVAAELKALAWVADAIGAPALADSAASISARLLKEQNWSRAGKYLNAWKRSALRPHLSTRSGRGLSTALKRGSAVLAVAGAAWDIHSKMTQGNSLPRAVFETGAGVAGSVGGGWVGCGIGAAIANAPGCLVGGIIGAIFGGWGADEAADATADRLVGPDNDG